LTEGNISAMIRRPTRAALDEKRSLILNISGLRGQTLNTFVPTVIWGLSVANMFSWVWTLSGPFFIVTITVAFALAVGFAWAFAGAATTLRDNTTASVRILLYAPMLWGALAAAWELVPARPRQEEMTAQDSNDSIAAKEPVVSFVRPVVDAEEWGIPRVPPGPAKLAQVPANYLDLIAQGQKQLSEVRMKTGSCGGKGEGRIRCVCDYILAVADPAGKIAVVDAYEGSVSSPPGYQVKVQITPGYERACGTNPVLDVSLPPGQTVLAVRTEVKTAVRGGSTSAVFTPYTDELNTPELREQGLQYWWKTVTEAGSDLRGLAVKSKFVPGALVTDLVSAKHVSVLGIIENIGVLAPFGDSGTEAGRLRELNAVLVMYGANGTRAFDWRVSKANAHGPLQFTDIFNGLRKQYPTAGLPEDWVAGALVHKMSARAAYLHSDEELRPLRKKWRDSLPAHPLLYGLYLAAGYNGYAGTASNGLERCSAEEWYGATCATLHRETRWYLRKYTAVKSMLFDPKTHERLVESQNASTAN